MVQQVSSLDTRSEADFLRIMQARISQLTHFGNGRRNRLLNLFVKNPLRFCDSLDKVSSMTMPGRRKLQMVAGELE